MLLIGERDPDDVVDKADIGFSDVQVTAEFASLDGQGDLAGQSMGCITHSEIPILRKLERWR